MKLFSHLSVSNATSPSRAEMNPGFSSSKVGTSLLPRCFSSKIKAKLIPHQELQSTHAGGCFVHPFSPYINNALISFPLGSATCHLAGEGQHGTATGI